MKESSLFSIVWLFVLFILFINVQGADQIPNPEKEKQILLEKDREISGIAAGNGVLRAFYPYLTEKSFLLPKKGHPVFGKETCAKLADQMEMDGRVNPFKWEPLFADISTTGDLGYTYGRYEIPAAPTNSTSTATGDNKKEINYGYYGTIWIKDAEGKWKVAFSQGLVLLKGLNQKPLQKLIDPEKADPITREVLTTERAFSDYSVANSYLPAFYRFIDDNGIALGSQGTPKKKADYAKLIADAEKKKKTDTSGASGKLEWEALFSHVAASGDLAYNFGTYLYTETDPKGNQQTGRGYFLTVWKKQSTGNKEWKFVMDCGNEVD